MAAMYICSVYIHRSLAGAKLTRGTLPLHVIVNLLRKPPEYVGDVHRLYR